MALRFFKNFSTPTATTTFIVVTTMLIITVIAIIIIITLPDLTPKEDLYWDRKCLVVEAIVQGAVSLHLCRNRLA